LFFPPILTEIEIYFQILANFSIAQFCEDPFSGSWSSVWKDGRTNMTKLTVAFRNFQGTYRAFYGKRPFVRLSVCWTAFYLQCLNHLLDSLMKLGIGVLHENLPISRHFRENRLINSRTLLEGVNETYAPTSHDRFG
jgi:hypothetical protein